MGDESQIWREAGCLLTTYSSSLPSPLIKHKLNTPAAYSTSPPTTPLEAIFVSSMH